MNKKWTVEYTDEFEAWWLELSVAAQDDIDRVVMLLEEHGHPYRVLYAFDPVRSALLLMGGDKTGNDNWYRENVPVAERLFAQHLKELENEEDGK